MAETPERDQQTEAPTPKRRQDAARDGDVLVSRELATALMMLAAVGWLALAGKWMVSASAEMLRDGLSLNGASHQYFDPLATGRALLQHILMPVGALLLASMAAAVAGPAILGSLGWRSKAIAFKGNRLSPLSGIKRMFGAQGVIELTKALAKAAIIGGLGWWLIDHEVDGLLTLATADPATASARLGRSLLAMLLALAVAILLIALVDVPVQIFQRNRRLRMSREQIKEEMRQSEGAPELKAAQRARQQAILSQSARKAMGEASVVLTNPQHFAVALRYLPGKDAAPLVLARGRDEVALAMRQLANDRAVPMLEYPSLTRALYFTTRAGQTIPEDLYQAVAVILAFVFRLDRELAQRTPPPTIEVPPTKRFDANGHPTAD